MRNIKRYTEHLRESSSQNDEITDEFLHLLEIGLATPNDVRKYLEEGVDVNAANPKDGSTGLHYSSAIGDVGVMKALIEAGADVNARGPHGGGPLHKVILTRNSEAMDLLIDNGASINAKDDYGQTPLLIAAALMARMAFIKLIDKGADVNTVDEDGRTPLHAAAKALDEDAVKILIGSGAYVNAANNDGDYAINMARLVKGDEPPPRGPMRRSIARRLIEAGADPSREFSSVEDAEHFFGNIDWMKQEALEKLKKRQRSQRIFGRA
jgi:ankyrin repeat protein